MTDINTLLQEIVDRRFRDLAGLRISATVPVRDSLINELIGKVLAAAAAPAASAPSETAARGATPTPPPGLPGGLRIAPSDIAPLIRKMAVRAEQGRIVLDLEIAID